MLCVLCYDVIAVCSLTSLSRLFSNSSRKRVIAASPSKSLKWLLTHSSTTRVTYESVNTRYLGDCQHTFPPSPTVR